MAIYDQQVAYLREYVAGQVGIEGAEVLPHDTIVQAVGSALADCEVVISPVTTGSGIAEIRSWVDREGRADELPPGLRSPKQFATRVKGLLGDGTAAGFPSAEIATAIAEHRADPAVSAEDRDFFERVAARALVDLLVRTPVSFGRVTGSASIQAIRDEDGNRVLASQSGLTVPLPNNNHSLLEHGPGIKRGMLGVLERVRGIWRGVTMVHNTAFAAEVSVSYAEYQRVGRRIAVRGDGMGPASEDLKQQREAGVFGAGFDAVLMSGLYRADTDQMATAVEAAPELLGPGGVLVIRDPEARSNDPNMVTPVGVTIALARRVFGADPDVEHGFTSEKGAPLREAVFVKS